MGAGHSVMLYFYNISCKKKSLKPKALYNQMQQIGKIWKNRDI
jgi:hypothetical protein